MKNNNFKINVWDLLQSAGKIDQFDFEKEKIESINWLSKDWISWDVLIQSFDQASLLVTLENLSADINEPCDTCNKIYTRQLDIDEYYAKFQKKIDLDESTDDEVFKIDGNENINIKDMITQAIVLKEPFAKRCSICAKKILKGSDDFDNHKYLEWTWNVTFS